MVLEENGYSAVLRNKEAAAKLTKSLESLGSLGETTVDYERTSND